LRREAYVQGKSKLANPARNEQKIFQFHALHIPRSKSQARMKSRWTNTHACQ